MSWTPGCAAVLSNTVPGLWSLLPFPFVVLLHQWQVQTVLEDPMHGLDASGQRGSEETWPPDVWETELTLAYSQQLQVPRCWQKGVAIWWVAVGTFCGFFVKFRVLGYFGQRIGKKKTTPLSWLYSPGVCWYFSFLWMKSVLYAWDFILLHILLTMCPQVQREAGRICSLLWWHCQRGSTGNVRIDCSHGIKHLSFSFIWA